MTSNSSDEMVHEDIRRSSTRATENDPSDSMQASVSTELLCHKDKCRTLDYAKVKRDGVANKLPHFWTVSFALFAALIIFYVSMTSLLFIRLRTRVDALERDYAELRSLHMDDAAIGKVFLNHQVVVILLRLIILIQSLTLLLSGIIIIISL